MLPSAVSTMPVPSSPESPDVTMIDTTDGSSVAAVCATEPDGKLTTGCTETADADPETEGVSTAAGVFVVFLVAATRPPATRAPTSAAMPATANNDGQPDRRPASVARG